jgi:lipopolysaccharide biosynthesis protein/predicted O-methyltransferase YrrM
MFFDFLKRPDNFISGIINKVKPTRAAIVAIEDEQDAAICNGRRFSLGSRPVIRWIKGDGLDDMITRAAIGQATQLFGSEVDYCICTQGIDANRARSILEWASQPVEWWPVSEEDNPQLAQFLKDAGCEPTNFGYWWKWFPERVRPDAPEWILDGDMVITGKPDWFQKWTEGYDVVRVSQDDAEDSHIYGNYSSQVNLDLMLYSGLVSLPPKCNYMSQLVEVLTLQPLLTGHNGKKDMSEQGVIAAAFQKLNPIPIPLYEFPFCRAFQDYIDFGLKGDQGRVWGYHFGNSFIMENPHFERLIAKEIIFSKPESNLIEKFQWLGSQGQWGIPGWTITDGCAKIILDFATAFKGKHVLEIGTSRGRLSAMLATLECKVTTIDHIDRGAFKNLQRLSVEVIIDDAIHFLETNNQYFDLIICDIHGNSPIEWKHYSKPLIKRIKSGSTLIISNALLFKIPEWQQETGVQWFLKRLPKNWQITLFSQSLPGIAVVTSKRKTEKEFISNRFIDRFPIIPSVKQQVSNLKGFRQMISWFKLYTKIIIIRQSTLFDKKYYLQKNPDVKLSGISAVKHYLLYGGFEGRNPSEKFDSASYLAENPDIKENGINPLVHYLKFGIKEGRPPLLYQQKKVNLSNAVNNKTNRNLILFLKKIKHHVFSNWEIRLIANSELFDQQYYLRVNADVKEKGFDPAKHYLIHGWKEGRDPSLNFDNQFYLSNYPDISNKNINPLLHYIKYGKKESRKTKSTNSIDYNERNDKYQNICFEKAVSTPLQFTKPPVNLIAFYLPQFHPIPENDEWWGKGFTEWTNVTKAKPYFEGHNQPNLPADLGFYDLRIPEVMEQQIEMAKTFGISAFCFYYYWFAGKRLLEKPLDMFLEHKEWNFNFCICWANENWTRRWDGNDHEILIAQKHSNEDDLAFLEDASIYLLDSRYIRINNKPLLIIYRPQLFQDMKETADRWRLYFKQKYNLELFIAMAQTFGKYDPREYGLDAAVEFPPHNITPKNITANYNTTNFKGNIFSTLSFIENHENRLSKAPYNQFRGVMLNWDNTPRKGIFGTVCLLNSPDNYRKWLTEAIIDTLENKKSDDEKLIFINAWNEWAEGTHLEPNQKYGFAYLNATRKALESIEKSVLIDHLGQIILKPQKRNRIAVILHVFYTELFYNITEYLKNISEPFDIYISIPEEFSDFKQNIFDVYPLAYVMIDKNLGRDIAPFLEIYRLVSVLDYHSLLKIHTKKSPHRIDGEDWRKGIFNHLLGSKDVVLSVQNLLEKDSSVGLIGPKGHVVHRDFYWGYNRELTYKLARQIGINNSNQDFFFVAGSMFWARPKALEILNLLIINRNDFEPEPLPLDGTLSHAIERLFGLVAQYDGFGIKEIDSEGLVSDPVLTKEYQFAISTKNGNY